MTTARILAALAAVCLFSSTVNAAPWVTYPGGKGNGAGKHVVLVSGDEEYRSEETLPQLGKILSVRHGFQCTVLFAIDPDTGIINPNNRNNIPGLEALDTADLLIMCLRFRDLPDEQMKHLVDYVEAGKPIVALRTSTHAFNIDPGKTYSKYDWRYEGADYYKGFGMQVLGETWVVHHGHHKFEATRGLLSPGGRDHPILRGLKDGDIFAVTDVYGINFPLPGTAQPLVLGQVLASMSPDDAPAAPVDGFDKNDPMMPVAWTNTHKGGRIFCTTMGSSTDFQSEGVRRLLVNATYWAAGLEAKISPKANVKLVGKFEPTPYVFHREPNYWQDRAMRPEDQDLK